ncbi:MAG: protein adenylyltransferase SelO family protein, partial [Gammaproteobacteria bacterium]|nr:protein adenylyltransferase SelO family protein [Gammaproteobacteria bacterium]
SDLMRKKLGLLESNDQDQHLLQEILDLMQGDNVDYTIFFRRLCDFSTAEISQNKNIRDLFMQREKFDTWAIKYSARLNLEHDNDQQRAIKMKQVNPKYILRNYMAEIAIKKAEDEKDYSEIDKLFKLLQNPFTEQPENEHYAGFPPAWAEKISVSCSS